MTAHIGCLLRFLEIEEWSEERRWRAYERHLKMWGTDLCPSARGIDHEEEDAPS